MRRLAKCLGFSCSLACLAFVQPALGERPYHNRGIAGVQLIPSTTSGTHIVRVNWFGFADTSGTPLDFDFELEIDVNEFPVWKEDITARYTPSVTIPVQCPYQGQNLTEGECFIGCLGDPCGEIALGGAFSDITHCECFGPLLQPPLFEPFYSCLCGWVAMMESPGISLVSGDVVRVTLTPAANAVPDAFTDDDSMEVICCEPVTGIEDRRGLETALRQNYPNPFNPTTTIRYWIRERGPVNLSLYDVSGRLVRTLVDAVQIPRTEGFAITWDGAGAEGLPVSAGVYFYRLTTTHFTDTKKMVILK